jgi:outer membrane protein assembly factor BamB
MPDQTIVCPVVWTPSGNLVLRLHDEILVLSARDGTLLWKKRSNDYWFCPTVAPDSGVLNITRGGGQLEKLNPEGARLWTFDLSGFGGPVAAPITLPPSGDTLVRTRVALLNIAPDGRLNWAVPLSVVTEGP